MCVWVCASASRFRQTLLGVRQALLSVWQGPEEGGAVVHFITVKTHASFPGKVFPLIEVVPVARWAVLASALVARLAVDGADGASRFETWRQEQLSSRPARTRDCGLFDTECWVVNLDVGLHLLHETWLHTGTGLDGERAGVSQVPGMHVVIASGGRELSG
jgi:hypothetical protein